MNAKAAWGVIAGWVLIYNGLLAKDGDLLSEQVDEWLNTHPVATRLIILALATHLANAVSPQRDVISLAFTAVRKYRREPC